MVKKCNRTVGHSDVMEYSDTKPMAPFIGDSLWHGSYSIVPLSKKFAEQFVTIPRLVGDRARARKYNMEVRFDMQNGYFIWNMVTLAKVFVEETGNWYRINGNTTAYTAAELVSGSFVPAVDLASFRVKTLNEARELLGLFDRGRPRNKTQRIRVFLMGSQGYDGLSGSDIRLLHQGLNLYLTEQLYELTAGELWFMLRHGGEFHSIAMKIRKLFEGFSRDGEMYWFRRPFVVAALFAMFSKYPTKTEGFWKALFSKKNLKPGLMTELRERILKIRIDSSKGKRGKKDYEMRQPEEAFRIIVRYWEYIRSKTKPSTQDLEDSWDMPRPKGYEGRKRTKT